MKKLFAIIFSLAFLAGCTADESTEVTETSGTSSVVTTAAESTEAATEAETSAVTEKAEEYSADVQKAARTFAKLVYRELENNKTAEDPTFLVPISCDREISETGFDSAAFEADIFFIDTDFDGVPELFAGGHGAMGTGRYSVFTADGGTYGNGCFAHNFCNFCIADGCMYVSSGSNSSWGWTKLCKGLPSIYFNGFWTETGTNDVYITLADGTEQTLTGLTFDESKALYPEYLGVEYDELNSVGEHGDIPFIYARGLLEVPDPENYTEEDIYNCLAKLLAEYEKLAEVYLSDKAAETAVSETTTVTKEAEAAVAAIDTSGIDYINGFAFIGQKNEAAVYQIKGEGFFRDENGEVTPLNNEIPYEWIYKLLDDIIVCQPLGNTQPCDVYIMKDGKPVLDEKISGQRHAMMFNRSALYNDGFEIIESVYDASSAGGHTFKKYQLYRDKDGFHEYGSIEVPLEEFNSLYGEAAQKCIDIAAEEIERDLEIYGVLYRGDGCFILNCRSPIFCEEGDEEPCGYRFYNLTLKPTDEEFSLVYWDSGAYKTALIPEIAVYPEAYYKEGEEWRKCIVY